VVIELQILHTDKHIKIMPSPKKEVPFWHQNAGCMQPHIMHIAQKSDIQIIVNTPIIQ